MEGSISRAYNVLVCGQTGQVANSIHSAEKPSTLNFTVLGRPELNLLDRSSILAAFEKNQPDLVINASAYTAVDQAELEPKKADALNALAVAELASIANEHGAPVIHLSTDYVFDGRKPSAYIESDPVRPLGVYGHSKLKGEQLLAAVTPAHVILRTAWVYSIYGNNFVKSMLRVAADRDELSVVDDQIGTPTSAHELAKGVVEIARQILTSRDPILFGTYHIVGSGEATWADFADYIFDVSERYGGASAKVNRISSAEWPTAAERPANSRLDGAQLSKVYGISLPDWRESTSECVYRLIQNEDVT